ncbi:CAP domain-containing protein [Ruegeria sp.]|uniref:CAP domain-containing protein n=1 Tax=Ruegeria sp. TaxID=1879320 RepID=UPI003B590CE6
MSTASTIEQEMLALINEERVSRGLVPLQLETQLNASSEDHSAWMLGTDTFSHTGEGGSSATERMRDAGFDFTGSWRSGENIAWQSERGAEGASDDVEQLHQSLMNSPGHRANILNPDFRYIGIGIEEGDYNGWDAVMVTQNFAATDAEVMLDTGAAPTPPAPTPVVDDVDDLDEETPATPATDPELPDTDVTETDEPGEETPDTDVTETDEPGEETPDTDVTETDEPGEETPDTDVTETDEPGEETPDTDVTETDEPGDETPDTDVTETDEPGEETPDTDVTETDEPSEETPNTDVTETDEPDSEHFDVQAFLAAIEDFVNGFLELVDDFKMDIAELADEDEDDFLLTDDLYDDTPPATEDDAGENTDPMDEIIETVDFGGGCMMDFV